MLVKLATEEELKKIEKYRDGWETTITFEKDTIAKINKDFYIINSKIVDCEQCPYKDGVCINIYYIIEGEKISDICDIFMLTEITKLNLTKKEKLDLLIKKNYMDIKIVRIRRK